MTIIENRRTRIIMKKQLGNECSDCRESMGDISKEEYDLLKEML